MSNTYISRDLENFIRCLVKAFFKYSTWKKIYKIHILQCIFWQLWTKLWPVYYNIYFSICKMEHLLFKTRNRSLSSSMQDKWKQNHSNVNQNTPIDKRRSLPWIQTFNSGRIMTWCSTCGKVGKILLCIKKNFKYFLQSIKRAPSKRHSSASRKIFANYRRKNQN